MKLDKQFFKVNLDYYQNYDAHIRKFDYSVIFSPRKQNLKSSTLFQKYSDILEKRQGNPLLTKRRKTFTVYIMVTDKCNLACLYCDVLGLFKNPMENGLNMKLTTAKVALKTLFNRLKQNNELHAQIVFFGGEPLLNWSLIKKICRTITNHEFSNRIEKMIVTNGTLLNEEIGLFLNDHKVYIVVSLDGGKTSNDMVRYFPNKSGSFEAISKGIDNIKKIMPNKFGISCTLGKHNATNLANEISFINKQFEPCCIGINIYHYQQNGLCPIEFSDEDLSKSLLNSFKLARKEGIAIYQFASIIKSFIERKRNSDYCPACVDKLVFTPTDRVGLCETMVYRNEFSTSLDEFSTKGLPKNLDWTKCTPEKEKLCLNCIAKWICPGSCVYDQFITTGEIYGTEARRCNFYINFFKELLALLLSNSKKNKDSRVIIPSKKDFGSVAGKIPLFFPKHTIFMTGFGTLNN